MVSEPAPVVSGDASGFLSALRRSRLGRRLFIVITTIPVLWFIASGLELGNFVKVQFASVSKSVRARAAIVLEEDFASGLGDWQAGTNLEKAWLYNGSGSVRPAALGLFKPSLALSNYEMGFRTIIDAGAVGWVFRAADHANYYAAKIVMESIGPPPAAALIRYAVVNGKAGPRVRTALRFHLQPGMQHDVQFAASGIQFVISIDGQAVDTWTDTRFTTGGVGFFCDRGERASIFHLRITCQNDDVGKLCALLASDTGRDDERRRSQVAQ